MGNRSVQSHSRAHFRHDERVVYRPTQCEVVYVVETTETSPGGEVEEVSTLGSPICRVTGEQQMGCTGMQGTMRNRSRLQLQSITGVDQ